MLVKLRRILEQAHPAASEIVAADRISVWVARDDCGCDVADFDTAIRKGNWSGADTLYAGDLLPGCDDPLIQEARERLRLAHRDALRHLTDAQERAGSLFRALESAERLAALEPTDDTAVLPYIRLLIAAGRVESARRRYRKFRRDT